MCTCVPLSTRSRAAAFPLHLLKPLLQLGLKLQQPLTQHYQLEHNLYFWLWHHRSNHQTWTPHSQTNLNSRLWNLSEYKGKNWRVTQKAHTAVPNIGLLKITIGKYCQLFINIWMFLTMSRVILKLTAWSTLVCICASSEGLLCILMVSGGYL